MRKFIRWSVLAFVLALIVLRFGWHYQGWVWAAVAVVFDSLSRLAHSRLHGRQAGADAKASEWGAV